MSKVYTLLKSLYEFIRQDDILSLKKYLDIMPINSLSSVKSHDLFYSLIVECMQFNKKRSGKVVFDRWKFYYDQKISFYTKLYLNPRYTLKILGFCATVFPNYMFVEGIDELMSMGDTEDVRYACERLQKVYGIQTKNTYQSLYDAAEGKSKIVLGFCADQLRKVNDYADIPEYMLGETNLPKESNVIIPEDPIVTTIPNYTINQIIELLLSGMSQQGIYIEEIKKAKELLKVKLMASTRAELNEIIKPILKKDLLSGLENDVELFRILGPSNPHYRSTLDELKYGGARMFESGAYDYIDDNDVVPREWFEGFCWKCNKRIRRRWHAIRRPVLYGGWDGVYCSARCLHESIDESDEPDIASHLLADHFILQLNTIGIYDRIPDDEYEDYLTGTLSLKYVSSSVKGDVLSTIQPVVVREDINTGETVPMIESVVEKIDPKKQTVVKSRNSEMSIWYVKEYDEFKSLMELSKGQFVIVKYTASWCGPCKRIEPKYRSLAKNNVDIQFAEVDIDRFSRLAKDIQSVPTFKVYMDGVPIEELRGANIKKLEELVNAYTK